MAQEGSLPIDGRLSWTLRTYALMAGLTQLIPIPILDDWCLTVVLDGLVQTLAKERNITVDAATRKILTAQPPIGCIGLGFAVCWWALKKLVRMILFFLEAKAMLDSSTRAWHLGLLLDHAMEKSGLLNEESAIRARTAIDTTLDGVETRLIERWLWGPFRKKVKQAKRGEVAAATLAFQAAPTTGAHRLSGGSWWASPETIAWFDGEPV